MQRYMISRYGSVHGTFLSIIVNSIGRSYTYLIYL